MSANPHPDPLAVDPLVSPQDCHLDRNAAAPVPASSLRRSRPNHPRDGLLIHLQALLEILILSIFIVSFLVQPFRIPSESMQPTLLVGDFLLVDKQSFAPTGGPAGFLDTLLPPTTIHRGDLVVFHYPVDPSMHLVKRVIGLPGDHLRLRDGRVYINGILLPERYAIYSRSRPDSFRDQFPSFRSADDPSIEPGWWAELRRITTNGEIIVPAGHFFVLGDNRNDSADSRYWGFVPQANIVGRPLLVYFSLATPDPTLPPPETPTGQPTPAQPGNPTFWSSLKSALQSARHSARILR